MECPIIAAIKSINTDGRAYDGGADDPADDTTDNIITGGDGTTYVCDDMTYHINFRTLEMARLEVKVMNANVTAAQAQAMYAKKYDELYAGVRTGHELYKQLLNKTRVSKFITEQFVSLMSAIESFEETIKIQISLMARRATTPAVTIPSINVPADMLDKAVVDPRRVNELFNPFIIYVNGIMIAGRRPVNARLIEPFASADIASTNVNLPAKLHDAVRLELQFATYIRLIERYTCAAIQAAREAVAAITNAAAAYSSGTSR